MSAESYVRELTSLDKEIKRQNKNIAKLKQQKAKVRGNLCTVMKNKGMESITVGDVTIKLSSLQPQKRTKTMEEKKWEAIKLFSEKGIDEPEELWDELRETQKVKKPDANGTAKKKKDSSKKPGEKFDPLLGF